ncbi:ISE/inbred ISE genomic scaffold [Striga asiatica]|uniref:ISE/inbred ISE genomic scaffold n=1 Tax=Striga asiatica TaxID=4170 RepID=A0A5A7P5Y7_STRAF|nr:ISE/inbred ISE genomic scaffold [Striga asiatica]
MKYPYLKPDIKPLSTSVVRNNDGTLVYKFFTDKGFDPVCKKTVGIRLPMPIRILRTDRKTPKGDPTAKNWSISHQVISTARPNTISFILVHCRCALHSIHCSRQRVTTETEHQTNSGLSAWLTMLSTSLFTILWSPGVEIRLPPDDKLLVAGQDTTLLLCSLYNHSIGKAENILFCGKATIQIHNPVSRQQKRSTCTEN